MIFHLFRSSSNERALFMMIFSAVMCTPGMTFAGVVLRALAVMTGRSALCALVMTAGGGSMCLLMVCTGRRCILPVCLLFGMMLTGFILFAR